MLDVLLIKGLNEPIEELKVVPEIIYNHYIAEKNTSLLLIYLVDAYLDAR